MFLVCSLLALALAELKISGKGLLNKILLLLLSGVGFVLFFVFFTEEEKIRSRGKEEHSSSLPFRGEWSSVLKQRTFVGRRESIASSLKGTLFRNNFRATAPRVLHIYQINASAGRQ